LDINPRDLTAVRHLMDFFTERSRESAVVRSNIATPSSVFAWKCGGLQIAEHQLLSHSHRGIHSKVLESHHEPRTCVGPDFIRILPEQTLVQDASYLFDAVYLYAPIFGGSASKYARESAKVKKLR